MPGFQFAAQITDSQEQRLKYKSYRSELRKCNYTGSREEEGWEEKANGRGSII